VRPLVSLEQALPTAIGALQLVAAADRHAARGVARVLGEFPRRRATHDLARQTPRHVHPPVAADARAGCAPQPDGLEVAADLEPDLFEQLIGVALDLPESFLGQQLVRRDRPGQGGRGGRSF
jgi:hypothetical protein